MPTLVDHFAGLTDYGPSIGSGSIGYPGPGAFFDQNELTWGSILGSTAYAIDAGETVTIHQVRVSWAYGGEYPLSGAASAIAMDYGDSMSGPWTNAWADTDPASTAGAVFPEDFENTYDLGAEGITARYWRIRGANLFNNNDIFTVNGYEIIPEGGGGGGGSEDPVGGAGGAILEIYVHDEDASRWGVATWATPPATGTEGIWSAAGWQDVTPEGVNAHVVWGCRRPGRGILSQQDPASWNVETYDPDRVLDPGNFDSPYWPQLVAGVPIRISHDSGLVIRTGIIDEISYKHKAPAYRGQILASDTIALLHKAIVPADSVLSDAYISRVIDAIEAAGIAVGGIPLPPPGQTSPTLAPWVEGAATDEGASVWEIVRKGAEETLWVPFVRADAGLAFRAWGSPLDRGREITAPNLEDLEALVDEDGVYSVARVQVSDPDLDPIEREAAPLPRYGRRVIDRREPTIDAEGWADQVLQERSWPGVQYIPGTVHCFSRANVTYFGSLETMERVTVIVPGAVSVQGRILGGELWVEHRKDAIHGATWQFMFAVATDGSTAIGLTTLVSDQAGDTLLDDATDTDYLEAD